MNYYHLGDKFQYRNKFGAVKDIFVLAQVKENHIALINIKEGNRFDEYIKVADVRAITEDEFTFYVGADYREQFTQIKK